MVFLGATTEHTIDGLWTKLILNAWCGLADRDAGPVNRLSPGPDSRAYASGVLSRAETP
jgi:hypothetical protein